METLKYIKTRKVKSPCRAYASDAGIDFFVPEDIDVDTFADKCNITGCHPSYSLNDEYFIQTIELKPGESVLLPSGIKVKVPDGYMLQFTNKSGIASKRGLLIGANTVDIGYEGECHINLHNVTGWTQIVRAGEKIAQGILVQIGFHQPEELKSENELYGSERSERAEGGFGSTGV